MSFQDLGLHESILRGVADAGYSDPTDIQTRAIPIALAGRDLVGLGQTGSGKTAAFGLPLLHRLLTQGEPGLRAVILVPTRELCVQVAENLRIYAKHTDLHICTAFGGIPMGVQEAAFRRGLDLLVACPGRMIDHIQTGNIELDRVEVLVLDEADRMLDMGFMPQIRRILTRLPRQRQNLLFSATMPPEIERLIADFLNDDRERVQVGERSQAAATVTQRFEEVASENKIRALTDVLRGPEGRERVLVFVNRKTRAEELGKKLSRAGLPADSIHGDKSAESRHVVLQAFSRGKVKHLVATDVAARGIDVTDIGLVVNFDMPLSTEDYIHRVGRTGRAGSDGAALSFIARNEKRSLKDVLAHLEKTSKDSRIEINGEVYREGKARKAKAEAVEVADEESAEPRSPRRSRRRDEEPRSRDESGGQASGRGRRRERDERSEGDERPQRRERTERESPQEERGDSRSERDTRKARAKKRPARRGNERTSEVAVSTTKRDVDDVSDVVW